MICRAVRFENWKTPSMISRFSSDRIPAFSLLRAGQDQAQLLGGVGRLEMLAGRMDADEPEDPPRHAVQQPDCGIGNDVERVQHVSDPERGPDRLLDGDRLRSELAENDVQHGNDGEGHRRGDGRRRLRSDPQAGEDRLQKVMKRRLADPAKRQG
jgi:hypothetical protein